MAVKPGRQTLPGHEPDKAVAAVGKGHDEHPQPHQGVAHPDPDLAEIHLGLAPGRSLQAHGGTGRGRSDVLMNETVNALVTGLEPLATKQAPQLLGRNILLLIPLPDLLQPRDQFIPGGRCDRRSLAQHGPHHLGTSGVVGITGESQMLGTFQVSTNRLATLAKRAGQLGDVLSLLPAKQ
ncbi:hypothetical protein RW64_20580 [Geobacter sulfurreducens]|nr:hypothetical protein RW64_20580 [Geobacter sulfurreducens]